MSAVQTTADGVVLALRVIPRASRSELCGEFNGAVKVKLREPPLDGRANKALAELLADRLGVRPRDVVLLSGAGSHSKRVLVRGVTKDKAEKLLLV